MRFGYAARSTRVSISLRSAPKSIGLVKSASAPLSNALRLVSTAGMPCPLMTQSGLGTKIAAVRDGSVSGDFGRYSVRTLFPLRANAELYRQRRATGQILALLQFRDDRRPQLPCLALKRNLHDYAGGLR